MDRDRFDALTKLLATSGSRRLTLGALLGLGLLGELPAALAERSKGKGEQQSHDGSGVHGEKRPSAAHKAHHRHKHTQRHRRKQRHRHHQGHHGKKPGLGSGECTANGKACSQNSDCCSENCFNFICADSVSFCGNTTCQPAASGCCAVEACCQPPANQCNPAGECCAPNCTGTECGPDGCGGDGTCGSCPIGTECNGLGQCVCDGDSCPNGCCDINDVCQPGTSPRACGGDGLTCLVCAVQEGCISGDCVEGACAGTCSQNEDCPNLQGCVCNRAQGACCTRSCAGLVCGPDGCGGTCGSGCPDGTVCSEDGGACLCTAESCPNGCCSNGEGNPGVCGNRCPDGTVCSATGGCVCTPQSCPDGCCDDAETCQLGNTPQTCGTGGAQCASCGAGEGCLNQQCVPCTPNCDTLGHSCGPDGCGGSCGTCEFDQVCVDGICVCNATGCPNGCCEFGPGNPGSCLTPSNDFCGIGGVACEPCGEGLTCVNGFCECVPDCTGRICGTDGCGGTCGNDCPRGQICYADGQCHCDSESCPNGCCTNGPGNIGTCQASNTACGTFGNLCNACEVNQVCVDGICVCNGMGCPDGCCQFGPGTPGVCLASSDDNCGIGGAFCQNCTAQQLQCVNGICAE
jgi:hypothetical protein